MIDLPSIDKLNTCHPDLQRVMRDLAKDYDIIIIDGFRTKEAQNAAQALGHSKLCWPKSPHNKQPSLAVDAALLPLDWRNTPRFDYFAGLVMATARALQIKLRWGGDWNRTNLATPNKFNDLVHFELIQ